MNPPLYSSSIIFAFSNFCSVSSLNRSSDAAFVMPSVSVFCRYFRVTSLAQAHKVIIIVCSAAGQRDDVVNLLGGCKFPFLQAHLAKRMICNVPVTDSFPCSSVPLTHRRITVIFFVSFIFLLLMLCTEPPVRKFRTAGIGTRPFRFLGHLSSPRFGHKKSPHRISPMKAVCIHIFILPLYHIPICIQVAFSGLTGFYHKPFRHSQALCRAGGAAISNHKTSRLQSSPMNGNTGISFQVSYEDLSAQHRL